MGQVVSAVGQVVDFIAQHNTDIQFVLKQLSAVVQSTGLDNTFIIFDASFADSDPKDTINKATNTAKAAAAQALLDRFQEKLKLNADDVKQNSGGGFITSVDVSRKDVTNVKTTMTDDLKNWGVIASQSTIDTMWQTIWDHFQTNPTKDSLAGQFRFSFDTYTCFGLYYRIITNQDGTQGLLYGFSAITNDPDAVLSAKKLNRSIVTHANGTVTVEA